MALNETFQGILHFFRKQRTDLFDAFHEIAGWMVIPLGFFILTGTVNLLEWLGLPIMLPMTRSMPRAKAAEPAERPIMEQPA